MRRDQQKCSHAKKKKTTTTTTIEGDYKTENKSPSVKCSHPPTPPNIDHQPPEKNVPSLPLQKNTLKNELPTAQKKKKKLSEPLNGPLQNAFTKEKKQS